MTNPAEYILHPLTYEGCARLTSAAEYLQGMVAEYMASSGVALMAMTIPERQAAVDVLTPRLKTEFFLSSDLWTGLPVGFSGNGAFLTFDETSCPNAAEPMQDGFLLVGAVTNIYACPVPTLDNVIQAQLTGENEPVAMAEQTMSAIAMLGAAQLIMPDGLGETAIADLSFLQVGVPLVYGMSARLLAAHYGDTFTPSQM